MKISFIFFIPILILATYARMSSSAPISGKTVIHTVPHFSYKIPFDDFYEIQRQNFQNYTII